MSAADGTNVVKVFQEAIEAALAYRASPKKGFLSDVVDLLADGGAPVGQTA